MKKITDFIRASLSLSPSEARGVLKIFLLVFGVLALMFGVDYFLGQKQQTLVISSPKVLDSLTVSLDNRPNRNFEYQQKNYPNPSNYSNNSNQKKLFPFDPNKATVEQFQELGLPKFIAERIEKYRNKGGKFKKKEDLAKIYGLLPETFERLEPYILLNSAENESLQSVSAISNEPSSISNEQLSIIKKNEVVSIPASTEKTFSKKPEILSKFDLNTADTNQLKMVKGIGSGYAKRIIKFRDLLGGFATAELVRETFQLPPETADELLKYAFVKGGFKRLKINELAEIKHPFLKPFQAKAIVSYRQQHGAFKSIEDLKAIKVLDEATINKIEPYFEF